MTGSPTAATIEASAVDDALLAAAEAVAGGLPAEAPWSARPAGAANPSAPGAEARALSVALPGVGRLVLAVSGPMARSVLLGPPPAEDLAHGLGPAIASAVAALCTRLGLAFPDLDDPTEIEPSSSLRPAAAEEAVLYDGDVHSATLALLGTAATPDLTEHEFAPLSPSPPAGGGRAKEGAGLRGGPIELLHEVEMGVTVELGRTRMLVRDILDLSPGSVIELDRAAGAPIDVLVNGTLIARGEVVVIDEEFGIRITEVIGYDDGSRGGR